MGQSFSFSSIQQLTCSHFPVFPDPTLNSCSPAARARLWESGKKDDKHHQCQQFLLKHSRSLQKQLDPLSAIKENEKEKRMEWAYTCHEQRQILLPKEVHGKRESLSRANVCSLHLSLMQECKKDLAAWIRPKTYKVQFSIVFPTVPQEAYHCYLFEGSNSIVLTRRCVKFRWMTPRY